MSSAEPRIRERGPCDNRIASVHTTDEATQEIDLQLDGHNDSTLPGEHDCGVPWVSMRFTEQGFDVPDALRRQLDLGEVIFVCGAGVSAAASLFQAKSSGDSTRNRSILERVQALVEEAEVSTLLLEFVVRWAAPTIEQYPYLRKNDLDTFLRVLLEQRPSLKGHDALAKLKYTP